MKEPDEAMAREGDGDIWRRMVDAALRARWDLDAALHGPAEAPPGGTDAEGDMPINAGDMQKKDPASWLQWSSGKDKANYAEPPRYVGSLGDRKQKNPTTG